MTHMIMDDRDRERLWEELLPTNQKVGEIYHSMPLFSLSFAATLPDPENRFLSNLDDCRAKLDQLEELHNVAQRIRENFKPQYPLVPLVGNGDEHGQGDQEPDGPAGVSGTPADLPAVRGDGDANP